MTERQAKPRLRVVLADDHPVLLAGTRAALEASGDFEIVGETSTGSGVLPLVARTNPDVALIDMRMPELDGLGCLERMRASYPSVKVVILSALDSAEYVHAALARHARAYIVKSVDGAGLAAAVLRAVTGTIDHPVRALGADENEAALGAGLTDREMTILRSVARGLSNQAIGKDLWITEQTVKFHLTNIYRKLDVANRTAAAGWAHANGLGPDMLAHGVSWGRGGGEGD